VSRVWLCGSSGQASVELVGALPLVLAVALGAGQLLAAGVAEEVAGHAAEAGAVALLQGGEPRDAARAAVPGWARDRMTVRVDGRAVRVRVRPPSPFPPVAVALEAKADAHAGEERGGR